MRAADIEDGRLPRPRLAAMNVRNSTSVFQEEADLVELAATAACQRTEARSRPGREYAGLNYIIISIIYEFAVLF